MVGELNVPHLPN